jgi:putative flippase GtrA
VNQFVKLPPFIGFIFIGALTVLVNLVTFQTTLLFGASIFTATFLGNLISTAANYAGLSGVFKSGPKFQTIIKYVVSWISYYFCTVWLVLLFIKFGFTSLESRVATLAILTPINYLVQKFLVFN